jgi:NAD-dependent SIR2 family protein deacetylase
MACKQQITRTEMDSMLSLLNPAVKKDLQVEFTPDGDAEIEATENFMVPNCSNCGGVLKPDVVFFGENVPQERAEFAIGQLNQAEALLVAGTSLTVNSGLRFVKTANKLNKPVVIVNIGPTKGDDFASAKIEANTSIALERLLFD